MELIGIPVESFGISIGKCRKVLEFHWKTIGNSNGK